MFELKNRIKDFFKKIVFNYTNFGKPNFPYNLEPSQLSEIVFSLDEVENIEGCICEIGVARGMTTRFICEHINNKSKNTKFYCIDTFSSFEKEDINYEVKSRNKNKSDLIGFSYNNFKRWKKNFEEFKFVNPIKADVKKFDFKKIKPIKLVILDVDLYVPTITALNNIKGCMSKGGILIVDDIKKNERWDGAEQAFYEFVRKESLDFKLVGNKCGVIKF